ncbi:DUF2868 domain-containing protein [Akkermansiaceae bacterium]|nr:DUF2868 domain-containing protein [Akkermansiaceae bacterium]MDB4544677.1 DUF2868 domain-containing protein [Akkermansiaceae bacterium]
MAAGKEAWSLEDLVDFEVAVHQSPTVDSEVGREVRERLREGKIEGNQVAQRRWGLKRWLESKPSSNVGRRVVTVTKLMGFALLVFTFLAGVGLVRGLVSDFSYSEEGEVFQAKGFNIWVFLAATLGVQWLLLIGGILSFVLIRRWSGGLGWLREGMAGLLRKFAPQVDSSAWDSLLRAKAQQRGALVWRLGRIAQLGGVGFNLGLLAGLFGVLWFTKVGFYWESSLPQFGEESLTKTVSFLSFGIEGVDPEKEMVRESWVETSSMGTDSGMAVWNSFFFFSLLVWGLLVRVLFWVMMIRKEREALARVDFQDLEHRKLWRELSRVERAVTIEGPSDGVVLLDVGGLNLEVEKLRPFLLQELRVNPEKTYSVGVMDSSEERESWEAMRKAPCGVVLFVEGWDLSPKQMTALFERIRREAGDETVLRVLVLGDGIVAPGEDDFSAWQKFIYGLRDPLLECVAFKPGLER